MTKPKPKVNPKKERTLDDAIEEWNVGTLECRGFAQHSWRRLTVTRSPGVITLHQRCPRCRKDRMKNFTLQMHALGNWRYTDVPGFTVVGHGRLTLDDKAQILRKFLTQVPVIEVEEDE